MRRVQRFLVSVVALAGCKALPPPPVLSPHVGTEPDREGATTAMIVVGLAGEPLGGGGVGVALRVEHQTTARTALGIELTGGRGDEGEYEDRRPFRHWLAGVRGYGRFTPAGDHSVALTYGAGLSLMATGLVTGTLHAGTEASYGNAHAVPLAALGFALAVPLREGHAFYETPLPDINFGEAEPTLAKARVPFERKRLRPRTELFVAFDLGLAVPLGDTGNRLSLDLGVAYPLRTDDVIFAASFADAQRFDPKPAPLTP